VKDIVNFYRATNTENMIISFGGIYMAAIGAHTTLQFH
jgi:hypothetical protein